MNEPAREEALAALREEIRRAGDDTRSVRLGGWVLVGGFGLLWLLAAVAGSGVPGATAALQLLPMVGLGLLSTSLWVAVLVFDHQRRARRRLARRLYWLDENERAQVLHTFAQESDAEIRRIGRPLLEHFGLPSELTPAAPISRGDERTPAE